MDNKELLNEIVTQNLERAADENLKKEERELAFKMAMDAIKQLEKMEGDNSSKKTKIIEYILDGCKIGVPLLTFGLTFLANNYFMNKSMAFEMDGTITSTFGKKLFNNLPKF